MHRSSFLPLVLISLGVFLQPASAGAGKGAIRGNAFGPFTIKVEIEGVTQGVFQAVEGLASQSEVITQFEDSVAVETPGPAKSSRLILKRPFDPLLIGLWRWRQSIIDGNPQKRNGAIFIFNASGVMVSHWVFQKGWPCRWEVPLLVSSGREPAEEIVEIVHTGLTLEPLEGS